MGTTSRLAEQEVHGWRRQINFLEPVSEEIDRQLEVTRFEHKGGGAESSVAPWVGFWNSLRDGSGRAANPDRLRLNSTLLRKCVSSSGQW